MPELPIQTTASITYFNTYANIRENLGSRIILNTLTLVSTKKRQILILVFFDSILDSSDLSGEERDRNYNNFIYIAFIIAKIKIIYSQTDKIEKQQHLSLFGEYKALRELISRELDFPIFARFCRFRENQLLQKLLENSQFTKFVKSDFRANFKFLDSGKKTSDQTCKHLF